MYMTHICDNCPQGLSLAIGWLVCKTKSIHIMLVLLPELQFCELHTEGFGTPALHEPGSKFIGHPSRV